MPSTEAPWLSQYRVDGETRGAEDQVVTPDDEDAETFRKFDAGLYTDVFAGNRDPEAIAWDSLFNMYVFAEKGIVPLLQNAAMDTIILSDANRSIPANQTRRGWTGAAGTSPRRTLVVDSWLNGSGHCLEDRCESHIDQDDISFVAAVAVRAVEFIGLKCYAEPDV